MQAQAAIKVKHTSSVSSRSIRILLVEDCKSDVFLFTRMLEAAPGGGHYDIVDVPRLIDAFKKTDDEYFDIILLDLNLLDIDGPATVAALHSQAPGTPIIVYSGMDDSKLKEKALMCGAAYYLVKGQESCERLREMIDVAVGR